MTVQMFTEERVTQRAVALALANRVRIDIAEWKRDLRAMSREDAVREVHTLLAGKRPPALGRVKVGHMLESVRGLGVVRSERVMKASCIRYDRHVGVLTDRECECILVALRRETGLS